jgi:hypothetical protein
MDVAKLVHDQPMDLLTAPLGHDCPHNYPEPTGKEGQHEMEAVFQRLALHEYGLELCLRFEPEPPGRCLLKLLGEDRLSLIDGHALGTNAR